jgi:hypothetical protein
MPKHRLVGLSALVSVAITFAGCVDGIGPLTERESVVETRALDPGGRFTIEDTNGRVEVATWGEPRVRIEADKAASSEMALKALRIEISGEGDRVDVRTHMPHGPFFGGRGRVNYRITLPASARVEARTVNGTVEVRGVAGAIKASTVNGSVEIKDAAGDVEASTVNGGVEADYRTAPAAGHHRFSTTNGGIDVTLPRDAGGRIAAHVVNGGIDCDFDVTDGQRSRRRLEGRLGPGDASFELNTVNGGIHLSRGLSSSPAKTESPAKAPAEAPAKGTGGSQK